MVVFSPFEVPPATASWGFAITHDEYNNIIQGFDPRSMDDKWTAVADTPDEQGNTIVHFYFGVRNREEVALTLTASKPDPAGLEAKDWGFITTIAWKVEMPGGTVITQKGAKSRTINLCNYLLNCRIEMPEGLESEDDDE
jgi:hypothetical protein